MFTVPTAALVAALLFLMELEMASTNFPAALARVLVHEGGYVNHPKDPGGETNKGVTKAVYDAYRRGKGQPVQSVRFITSAEVADIYRRQYWAAVRADELASGLDYAVFDLAVNSGPVRAVKMLQQALGVKVDGHLGLATLEAARKADAAATIKRVCGLRLSFLHRLGIWSTFGKGWSSRVAGVEREALSMAKAAPKPAAAPAAPPRRAVELPALVLDRKADAHPASTPQPGLKPGFFVRLARLFRAA